MTANKGYEKYFENSVFTASKEELTLMLYNGLVKFILQGRAAIEVKDIMKAHRCLMKAQDIIIEFQSTLNMEYEISTSLLSMYDYMYRRLVEANLKKNVEILDEVLEHAKGLRDTWSQAMKIAKTQNQPCLKAVASK